MLKSQSFKNDPRIQEAKKLILDALKEHQGRLDGPKEADPALKSRYDGLIEELNGLRSNKIHYPYLGSGIGKGTLVELVDGSVKYDFITGIGVHTFGHSSPLIVEAGIEAALSDTVMEGHLQQNEDVVELSRLLKEASGLPHAFISSSGAMANENGLKVLFQKRAPAYRLLAFENCFVGRTLALSQINDRPKFREGLPPTLHVDYIPFYDPERPSESTQEAARLLTKLLERYPDQYAGMIFELVQGEGGFYVGSTEFFVTLANILKRHSVPLFVDEIQTFGRTPALFAFQYFELEPFVDVVSIGKLTQVCATLFSEAVAPKAGLLSQTFIASVSAIRIAKVIIEALLKGHFFGEKGRLQRIHDRFVSHLSTMGKDVRGPWGIGSMIAFTVYDGSYEKANAFAYKLFEAGLIVFIAGNNPTRIRLLPPALVVTDEEIDHACRIIRACL